MGATAGMLILDSAMGSAGAALAAGVVANKVFGGSKSAPAVAPVTRMPDPLEQDAAKRRSIAEQMARSGRAASIMTEPAGSQKLGG